MTQEIKDWSTSAAGNGFAAPDGFPENMNYSEVNDAAREIMAVIRRWHGDTNGALATGGAADVYTLTPNRTVTAYTNGLHFRIQPNATNTGASTLNVSAVGARSIVTPDNAALSAGRLTINGVYDLVYSSTLDKFVLLGQNGVFIGDVTGDLDGDIQKTSGDVVINAPTGQDVDIQVNGTTVATVTSAGRVISTQRDYIEMELDSSPGDGNPYTSTNMTEKNRSGFAAISTDGKFNVPVAGDYYVVFNLNPEGGGNTINARIERFNSSDVEQEQREGDAAQGVPSRPSGIFTCDAGDYFTFDHVSGTGGYTNQESYIIIHRL